MEVTIPYSPYSDDDSSTTGSRTPSSRLSIDETSPEPWQCKYTGKVCPNPRAKKTSGKLHRLCEEHRIRANVNQRRLQQKRRLARAEMLLVAPYPVDKTEEDNEPLMEGWGEWVSTIINECSEQQQGMFATPEPLTTPGQLTEEDVEALTMLFTSNMADESMENEFYQVMRTVNHTSEL